MSDEASSASTRVKGPLAGVRVLDLSRILAGPFCAQMLADFGAEVIKVERPVTGDDTRTWAPPWLPHPKGGNSAQTTVFSSVNRGKESIAVDLSKPEGADLIRRLAAASDVLVENYKVGTLDRYGLGYADLATVNPGLIYCSISGFGQTGPYRSRAGYDTIAQAMGGLMSVTGRPDGKEGAGPQRAGIPLVDLMTGVYALAGIFAALRHRDATGEGQHVDLALLDVQVASLIYFGLNYLALGEVPKRIGNANPVVHPSGVYRCLDGELMIIVGNDEQFRRFCKVIGLEELADDPRFRHTWERRDNAAELDPILEEALSRIPAALCAEQCEAEGIPCGPINNIAQVFADPQVQARETVVELEHPEVGKIPILANPIRLSRSPARYERPPPLLAEHTGQVLKRVLGLSAEQVADLQGRKVVG